MRFEIHLCAIFIVLSCSDAIAADQSVLNVVDHASLPSVNEIRANVGSNFLSKKKRSRYPQGKVYDLCNDSDALSANLDGNDLSNSRLTMGVDCISNSGHNRYAHVSPSGTLVFRSNIEPIFEDNDSAVGNENGKPLGYKGPLFNDNKVATSSNDDFGVLIESAKVRDNHLYGLAINKSTKLAKKVNVEIFGYSYEYPLSVQSGEIFPFKIEYHSIYVQTSDITFSANTSNNLDSSRSLTITGDPGYLNFRPEKQYIMGEVYWLWGVTERDKFYQTGITIEKPSSHPGLSEQISSMKQNKFSVVVALLDVDGKVEDVYPPATYELQFDEIDAQQIEPTRSLSKNGTVIIGISMPIQTNDIVIWAGRQVQW